MMIKTLGLMVVISTVLTLAACAKQENSKASEQATPAHVEQEQVSLEQQAAIDALDQPILDEKNTDIRAEMAKQPEGEATMHGSLATSSATSSH